MNKIRENAINNGTYRIIGTLATDTFIRVVIGHDSHGHRTQTPEM